MHGSHGLELNRFCLLFIFFDTAPLKINLCIIPAAWSRVVNKTFSVYQSDELSLQKKLRTEVIQLEDTLAQVRKEYEMLRIEFEQNLAANEQAGTIRTTHANTVDKVGLHDLFLKNLIAITATHYN